MTLLSDQPTLYVFAISHYCEKARWTLDYLGIDHRVEHLAPGMHSQIAGELGAPGTSLPILVSGETVVQGSDAIFDWASSAEVGGGQLLSADSALTDESRALEKRLDAIAGVQTRRYFYSEALVEYPEIVLPVFAKDLKADAQETLESIWGIVRQAMLERMDLGREQWDDARGILETELDWLDGLLSDGRPFLIGDHFSRVDITGASLLALLAETPEHATYRDIVMPARVRADIVLWRDRPSVRWVRDLYSNFRHARAAS